MPTQFDWSIVAKISTGVALVAFVAAVGLYAWYRYLKNLERLVGERPDDDRRATVQAVLDGIAVDTQKMDADQLHDLAVRVLAKRSKKALYIFIAVIALFLCTAAVAIVRIVTPSESGGSPEPPKVEADAGTNHTRRGPREMTDAEIGTTLSNSNNRSHR